MAPRLWKVGAANLDDAAVTEGKIGALAVTEGKIGALAVTEGKIGASAVTDAKLVAAVQDAIPYLLVTVTNDADGTGYAVIQAKDAAGNDLAATFLVHVWIAEAEFVVPEAQTDFSVTDGTQWEELAADADYMVLSDEFGYLAMNIETDVAPDGSLPIFVMAEIGGRIYSGTKTITNPA